ncbi:DUF4358 domain-containing protein [Marasmitruncus massiliensis]|uniref:DUF4358 domain-containing protein n=1 Tax=Marasmitruncus massiliensis TaxID=1944642 RepID=UPI000C7D0698|nr:DUF4358 domain-containing protein [Marasmitruncus massiliensis]
MKKLVAGVLAAVACMMMFSACGKGSTQKEPATADVAKAVVDQLTFRDELMVLDDKQVDVIYRLEEDKIAEKTCYVSGSRATAEEVSVFKVKDTADVQMVKDAIEERIEDQKIAYENYVPEEMVKINGAVTYQQGNYVILVMADDTSSVEDIFKKQF